MLNKKIFIQKVLSPDQVRTHLEEIEAKAFKLLKPGLIDQRYWTSISGNILRHCSWNLNEFADFLLKNKFYFVNIVCL